MFKIYTSIAKPTPKYVNNQTYNDHNTKEINATNQQFVIENNTLTNNLKYSLFNTTNKIQINEKRDKFPKEGLYSEKYNGSTSRSTSRCDIPFHIHSNPFPEKNQEKFNRENKAQKCMPKKYAESTESKERLRKSIFQNQGHIKRYENFLRKILRKKLSKENLTNILHINKRQSMLSKNFNEISNNYNLPNWDFNNWNTYTPIFNFNLESTEPSLIDDDLIVNNKLINESSYLQYPYTSSSKDFFNLNQPYETSLNLFNYSIAPKIFSHENNTPNTIKNLLQFETKYINSMKHGMNSVADLDTATEENEPLIESPTFSNDISIIKSISSEGPLYEFSEQHISQPKYGTKKENFLINNMHPKFVANNISFPFEKHVKNVVMPVPSYKNVIKASPMTYMHQARNNQSSSPSPSFINELQKDLHLPLLESRTYFTTKGLTFPSVSHNSKDRSFDDDGVNETTRAGMIPTRQKNSIQAYNQSFAHVTMFNPSNKISSNNVGVALTDIKNEKRNQIGLESLTTTRVYPLNLSTDYLAIKLKYNDNDLKNETNYVQTTSKPTKPPSISVIIYQGANPNLGIIPVGTIYNISFTQSANDILPTTQKPLTSTNSSVVSQNQTFMKTPYPYSTLNLTRTTVRATENIKYGNPRKDVRSKKNSEQSFDSALYYQMPYKNVFPNKGQNISATNIQSNKGKPFIQNSVPVNVPVRVQTIPPQIYQDNFNNNFPQNQGRNLQVSRTQPPMYVNPQKAHKIRETTPPCLYRLIPETGSLYLSTQSQTITRPSIIPARNDDRHLVNPQNQIMTGQYIKPVSNIKSMASYPVANQNIQQQTAQIAQTLPPSFPNDKIEIDKMIQQALRLQKLVQANKSKNLTTSQPVPKRPISATLDTISGSDQIAELSQYSGTALVGNTIRYLQQSEATLKPRNATYCKLIFNFIFFLHNTSITVYDFDI